MTHKPQPDPLLFLTTVSALDGTVFLLAAQGTFSHLASAIAAGLTVVAGGGAWTAAWTRYGGRPLGREEWRRLLVPMLLGGLATPLATVAGVHFGDHLDLRALPLAAGLGLVLLGLEVGGLRLPRPAGLAPVPALLGVTAVAEVLLHWIP